jgi:hypothetical protein
MNDEMLLYTIRDKLPTIATSYQLTYHNNYGRLHDGAIIPGTKEAIILTANPTGPVINILYHNHYNLNWEIGNPTFKDGIAFIELNLFALAREYYRWQFIASESENIFNFLYKKALYPMLPKYMDIAMYNRHCYQSDGVVLPPDPKVTEYRIPMIEDRIQRHIDNVERINASRRLNVASFLEQIPLFFHESALELVPKYPSFYTNQSKWIYTIAKLPYIYNGLNYVAKSKNHAMNRRWIGNLNRFVKTFRGANTLTHLPKSDQSSLYAFVDQLDESLSRY